MIKGEDADVSVYTLLWDRSLWIPCCAKTVDVHEYIRSGDLMHMSRALPLVQSPDYYLCSVLSTLAATIGRCRAPKCANRMFSDDTYDSGFQMYGTDYVVCASFFPYCNAPSIYFRPASAGDFDATVLRWDVESKKDVWRLGMY